MLKCLSRIAKLFKSTPIKVSGNFTDRPMVINNGEVLQPGYGIITGPAHLIPDGKIMGRLTIEDGKTTLIADNGTTLEMS